MNQQLLFEQIPNPTIIYDRDTLRILKVSASFCAKYKYSSEEVDRNEMTIRELLQKQDRAKFDEYLKNGGTGKNGNAPIWRHQSKEGEIFYVKQEMQMVSFENYSACLVSLNDVTDQINGAFDGTDAALQKGQSSNFENDEDIFEKLFINAPQAIVLVDMANRVLKVNNSFLNLFGYEAKELLGNDLNKVIRAGEGYEKAPRMNDADFSESQIYSELKRFTKAGKPLDLILGGIPVYKDGELIGGFGIYMNITGQKNTQHKLEQLLNEKQVLIEEVHHRVKNNLAVISGLLQMQTLHVDDERLTKYIRNSQLRIQSMAIVHEMLYKSKTLSQIKMNAYLEKLASIISDTLGPNDKTIQTIVESDDIVLNVNQAIPAALIISELITNAYEYAFEGQEHGKVTVNLGKQKNEVTVSVRDNGIGLPDNFEEMRQKSLGLSLVENLCVQLETEIEIDSGDWGTRFSFVFQKKNTPGSSSSNRV